MSFNRPAINPLDYTHDYTKNKGGYRLAAVYGSDSEEPKNTSRRLYYLDADDNEVELQSVDTSGPENIYYVEIENGVAINSANGQSFPIEPFIKLENEDDKISYALYQLDPVKKIIGSQLPGSFVSPAKYISKVNVSIDNVIGLSTELKSKVTYFDTVDQAINESDTLKIFQGSALNIKSAKGASNMFDVVLTSSVSPSDPDVFQSVSIPNLSLKLRRDGVINYSVPSDFDTLDAALNYISSIKQDAFTSINLGIDSGFYTFNETTVIPNQNSEKLSITGAESDTVILTGYVGATGSERDFLLTVSVNQSENFIVGRYCICTVTSGNDNNHYLVRGCWEVIQKSGNNITLRVTHKISSFPEITSLSGEITPLNTVLKYIDVDGIVSRGANLGNLNHLAVVGNSDDYWNPSDVSGTEKGTHGIYVSGLTVIGQQANKGSIGGGSITCGIEGEGRVGVNGFDQQGFVTDMNGAIFNYTCASSNNKRRGMYVAGGKIRCKFGAATGNYLDGIIADYGNCFEGSGMCASGNGSAGVSSANGSSLTAPNGFYTHNKENVKAVKGGYLEVTKSFYSDSSLRDVLAENGGIVISNSSTFSSEGENIRAASSSYVRADDSEFTEPDATHINAQESTVYHSDSIGIDNTATVNSILRDNSTYGNYRADYLIEGLKRIYATGEMRINHESNPVYSRMVTTSGGDLVLGGNTANSLTLRFDGQQIYPSIGDNLCDLGRPTFRIKEIYAGNGTINTSDAREKTEISKLSNDELNASKQLANEIGSYQWLASIESKGEEARKHIGMTVQRAIEIMEGNNLDAFSYGFICFDEWESEDEQADDEGNIISISVEAGDRYGFRYSQLAMFILAGLNQRLDSAGI